jgi:hypothetical protein
MTVAYWGCDGQVQGGNAQTQTEEWSASQVNFLCILRARPGGFGLAPGPRRLIAGFRRNLVDRNPRQI